MTPRALRAGMVIGALFLVTWAAYMARGALFPFALGAIVAYVIAPLVERLSVAQPWYATRPETARGISVLTIYGGTLAALVVAGIFVVPDIVHEADQLIDDVPRLVDDAQAQVDEWVARYEQQVPESVRERINEAINSASDDAGALAEAAARRSLGLVFSTVSALLGYIAIPFFVFYALKDRDRALGRFYEFFPESIRPDVRECVRIANQVLGAYVRAQLTLAVIIFAMTLVGLRLMGVEFSLALAVFAGLTEMIPIIGPIIGFVPAFIVVLATDPERWWWVILFYLGVQAAENYLLVPRIHGESVHMHPALVLILIAIGAALFGLWGVLLIVPLAAAARDVFAYIFRRLGEEDERRKLARAE
ncbi:MAG: AI-2E family transporter [Thermoflexaceae bacterium]|nr:AI-2E family transporter [Thermoflexaceae bacterium]